MMETYYILESMEPYKYEKFFLEHHLVWDRRVSNYVFPNVGTDMKFNELTHKLIELAQKNNGRIVKITREVI